MDIIKGLFEGISLSGSLNAILEGVSGQVTELLPIGVSLMGVLAAPRIIKRVLGTFI